MLAEIADPSAEQRILTEMLTQMKKILTEKGLSFVQFYVSFVDEILPDKSTGKKRLIVRDTAEADGAA